MESEETPPAISDKQIADFFRENENREERPEDKELMEELLSNFVREGLPRIFSKPEFEPEKILALSNDILAFQKLMKPLIDSILELIAAMTDKPAAALIASPFYAKLIALAQIKTFGALNAKLPEKFPFLILLAEFSNGENRFVVVDKKRFPGVDRITSGKKETLTIDTGSINPKTGEPFVIVQDTPEGLKPVKFSKKRPENFLENLEDISGLNETEFITFLSALVFLEKNVIRFKRLVDISGTFVDILEALKINIKDFDSSNPSLKDLRERFGVLYCFNRLLELSFQKSLISLDSTPNREIILTINIDEIDAKRILEASKKKEQWIVIARLFLEST